MNHFSLKELTGIAILFFVSAIMVFSSRTGRLYNSHAMEFPEQSELLIEEKAGIEHVMKLLSSQDVWFDDDEIVWASATLGWRSFQPGRYLFEGHVSYADLFSKLARGIQDPSRVTVLPGTDPGRFSRLLSMQLRPDSIDFVIHFTDSSAIAEEYGLTGEQLFSRMLPNTYEMYWTSNAESVIRRLLSEFDNLVVSQFQDEIEASSFTLEEIITLASIVEWEARHREEKPKISGLYLNRLERGMLLQADPTVLYALGERRRLLFEDYQFDHPYNTYRNTGLPPGPITNPDISSIRSVLYPDEHDYLFMVATPEGSHHFSKTFQEHRQASEKWRRWLREQYRIRRELESRGEQGENG